LLTKGNGSLALRSQIRAPVSISYDKMRNRFSSPTVSPRVSSRNYDGENLGEDKGVDAARKEHDWLAPAASSTVANPGLVPESLQYWLDKETLRPVSRTNL